MSQDRRPDPDPTRLTTDALLREIEHLKELHESQREDDRKLYDSKILGIESAVDKAFSAATLVTRAIDEKVSKNETRLTIVETGGRAVHAAKGEGFNFATVVASLVIAGLACLVGIGSLLYNFWSHH